MPHELATAPGSSPLRAEAMPKLQAGERLSEVLASQKVIPAEYIESSSAWRSRLGNSTPN